MNMDCRNALAARHRNYPHLQLEQRASLRHNSVLAQTMLDFELIRRRLHR
jgi:hypothetical protein